MSWRRSLRLKGWTMKNGMNCSNYRRKKMELPWVILSLSRKLFLIACPKEKILIKMLSITASESSRKKTRFTLSMRNSKIHLKRKGAKMKIYLKKCKHYVLRYPFWRLNLRNMNKKYKIKRVSQEYQVKKPKVLLKVLFSLPMRSCSAQDARKRKNKIDSSPSKYK